MESGSCKTGVPANSQDREEVRESGGTRKQFFNFHRVKWTGNGAGHLSI